MLLWKNEIIHTFHDTKIIQSSNTSTLWIKGKSLSGNINKHLILYDNDTNIAGCITRHPDSIYNDQTIKLDHGFITTTKIDSPINECTSNNLKFKILTCDNDRLITLINHKFYHNPGIDTFWDKIYYKQQLLNNCEKDLYNQILKQKNMIYIHYQI